MFFSVSAGMLAVFLFFYFTFLKESEIKEKQRAEQVGSGTQSGGGSQGSMLTPVPQRAWRASRLGFNCRLASLLRFAFLSDLLSTLPFP